MMILNTVKNSVRKRIMMGRTILVYIEIENADSYKFHICDISDNLNHFIKLEDYKINVIIIKINFLASLKQSLKKR